MATIDVSGSEQRSVTFSATGVSGLGTQLVRPINCTEVEMYAYSTADVPIAIAYEARETEDASGGPLLGTVDIAAGNVTPQWNEATIGEHPYIFVQPVGSGTGVMSTGVVDITFFGREIQL